MREFIHPQDIAIPELRVTQDGKESAFPFRFVRYVNDMLAADEAWAKGGTNAEAAARLATLIRFQTLVDGTKPGERIELDEDDHETTCKVARACAMGYQGQLAPCNAKKPVFLLEILSAKRVVKEG